MIKLQPQLKSTAIELRKRGLSYGEIKKQINVAKSTLSLWLKTIPLTENQKERLYTKKILILSRGPQSQKERRLREISEIIDGAEKEIKLPNYGTIKILVLKGTDMRHRVFGWIKATLKEIEPEIEITQKEWKILKETPRPVNLPEEISNLIAPIT